ncbi:MAG: hypothetical protein M1524_01640 [Patescibacteria group bacterium]|nr:hypothetical protein [Patescibacteria group bacterium]
MPSSKEVLHGSDKVGGFTSFVKRPGRYLTGVKKRMDPEVLVNSGVISTLNRGVIGLEFLATPFISEGIEHIDPKQRMIIAGTAMTAGLIVTSGFELKTLRSKKNSSPSINTNFYRAMFGGSALAGMIAARIHGVVARVSNPTDVSAIIGSFVIDNTAPICASTISAAVIGTTASVLINKYYREDRMGLITEHVYPAFKKVTQKFKEQGDMDYTRQTTEEIEIFRASRSLQLR